MEKQLSEVLDNLLGLLLFQGSYEVNETETDFMVDIKTDQSGRLIGAGGQSLDALQLIINQIMGKKSEEFKRAILDVSGWRKEKEQSINERAKEWIKEVTDSGKPMELEPMPSWQRRIVHMAVSSEDGVESESVGEGRDRHLVIRPKNLS